MVHLKYIGEDGTEINFSIDNYWILIEDYDLVKYGNLNEFDRPTLDVLDKELVKDLGKLVKKDTEEGSKEGVLYINYKKDKNKEGRILEVDFKVEKEEEGVKYVYVDYRTVYMI